MRPEKKPWVGIVTALAVCLPAAGLLIVTGCRCRDAFDGSGSTVPEWLWRFAKAIGPNGALYAFLFAAATVIAIPIGLLLHHWRNPTSGSISDDEVRRALGPTRPRNEPR